MLPGKTLPNSNALCLFQGNLNPKDLKRYKIATQSFFFFFFFFFFDTNHGRQTEIYAPELVTLVVAFHENILAENIFLISWNRFEFLYGELHS